MTDEKIKDYPKSKDGNFYVKDTIGVPHPYCITPKHVGWASDHFGGMLGKEAIIDAEENGNAVCDICRKAVRARKQEKILPYEEHKQALLIGCKKEIEKNKELNDYLISIKEKVTQDGFAGFAFIKEF